MNIIPKPRIRCPRTEGMVLFCAAISLFAGCARFESKPLSPEKSLARFEERGLMDSGLKAFLERTLQTNLNTWPLDQWNLCTLTLAAYYYSPDLDLARANRAVAHAGEEIAAERPNPTVSVSPAYNTTTAIPSPWLAVSTLDVPIETAGKRRYRIAQAKHLTKAAVLNIDAIAWQLRSKIRGRLLELYSASRTKSLLESQQAVQDENIRLLERQFESGSISAFELTQARLARESSSLALIDAQGHYSDARLDLAEAVGVPSTALDRIQFSFQDFNDFPTEPPTSELRKQALMNRSDILAALSSYEATQAALQLEIARQYPDVHLNPGYEYDQGDNKWSFGLTITLPIINQNRGAIAEASARRTESAANFNALQAKTVSEIDRALSACKTASAKRAETSALLSDLQKQEKRARAMLEAGEIARTELAALRLQLSATEITCLEASVKSQAALGQLEDALQSPLGFPPSAWRLNARESTPPKSSICP